MKRAEPVGSGHVPDAVDQPGLEVVVKIRASVSRHEGSSEPVGRFPREVRRPVDDPQRLAAVRRLVPMYRPPSLQFDRLTSLCAQLLDAPVALLTLVEADRQFFVSSYGLPEDLAQARQTPIEYSICQYAVVSGQPLIVPDTSLEPRLADHPAVREFGIATYAGIPLVTNDDYGVGTLCVMDFVAREWNDYQLSVLATLAAICMDEIRLSCYERRSAFDREWRGVADNPAVWRS